jgi:catalase
MPKNTMSRRGVLANAAVLPALTLSQKRAKADSNSITSQVDDKNVLGKGGEEHPISTNIDTTLTTNQGVAIEDDQNSLHIGPRGPSTLEDFILREKITHFDHERIPERVVHARGTAAHGYFELTNSLADVSKAEIFQKVGERTPVFARFSTVAGNRGSTDMARDVRGFAVKMYTKEGNWDLVGNNIPVFFIQDAMKFPDLVHAVKEEPDRGFPQAASAHDTFWDFTSLMPESMHMIMWIMSDRALPRSLRMMDGFGVHTFRLLNQAGKSTYVKFHWRPELGKQSVVWDEAVKISGADPDYHRRDLWNSISKGEFPAWTLSVQLFNEEFANTFEFDVLDSTKLIPEEILPLRAVGRMVLDRNPTNVFAETEQVAFCTSNVIPGIDFTNDPLLQGRNFSYLDTQLKRLGGPNFHQIPINTPRCPMHNFQRDGHMQMSKQEGRISYNPSALDGPHLSENDGIGFVSFPEPIQGDKLRVRSQSFADHYSQARQFYMSQTKPEQDHIIAALIFELSRVEAVPVRVRMLSHLVNIDDSLAQRVAQGLGYTQSFLSAPSTTPVRKEIKPSVALSILANAKPTFKGRVLGCLLGDGADAEVVAALRAGVDKVGGTLKTVTPKVGGVIGNNGQIIVGDYQLDGGPSVFFDAVAVLAGQQGVDELLKKAKSVEWVHDAFSHLKVMGFSAETLKIADMGGVKKDKGVITLSIGNMNDFVALLKDGRIWDREPKVRPL